MFYEVGSAYLTYLCQSHLVYRYKKKARYISYAHHTTLRTRVADGFQLSEIVAAVHNDLILVIFYRLYHQYDATFVLINLDTCKIVSCIESPTGNMSIMECHISPDGSRVAVLFFMRKDNLSPFRCVGIICMNTAEPLS